MALTKTQAEILGQMFELSPIEMEVFEKAIVNPSPTPTPSANFKLGTSKLGEGKLG